MGDKISNLPNGTTPLSGTESVPVVQNGNTVKVVSSSFKTTNAADLTSGTVSAARLPIASNVSAGIVQLGSLTGQACDGADARLSDARTPAGAAGGDLSGTYPNPQLAASGVSAGTFGTGSVVPVITVDSKGRLTNVAQASIPIPQAATTTPLPDGVASAGNSSSYARADHIHQASSTTLTGDVVGTGTGTVPTTLSNTGVSQGTYGSSSLVPVVTVDSKGRVLAVSEQPFSSTQGGTVTSVNVSGGSTGLTVSGGPITDAGTLSLGGTLAVASGGTGSTSAVSALANLGGVSSSLVGTVNGLATLDGGGKVPYAQLPGALGSAQVATLDGNSKVPLVQLYAGMNNGLATLDAGGKVPTAQLPSYVDDVVEVADFAALPAIGEASVIYVTLDTNLVYRWSGSVYVEISASPVASNQNPIAVSTSPVIGISLSYSRQDHVHALPTTGVVAGNYGSTSIIPAFSVDSFGRITSVTTRQVSALTGAAAVNSISSTNYTLALSDAQNIVNSTAIGTNQVSVIVPAEASINFPIGSSVSLLQTSTSDVIVLPASQVSVLSKSRISTGIASKLNLIKYASNAWHLSGDLTSDPFWESVRFLQNFDYYSDGQVLTTLDNQKPGVSGWTFSAASSTYTIRSSPSRTGRSFCRSGTIGVNAGITHTVSGECTFEVSFYIGSSFEAGGTTIAFMNVPGGTYDNQVTVSSAGVVTFTTNGAGGTSVTGPTVSPNTWVDIALSKTSSGTIYCHVNGVYYGSLTNNRDWTSFNFITPSVSPAAADRFFIDCYRVTAKQRYSTSNYIVQVPFAAQ
jgi:hypothetical protein